MATTTDTPRYRRTATGLIQSLQELVELLQRELEKVENALNSTLANPVAMENAAPSRPTQGLIKFADGVNWNPGSGRGLYIYDNGT